MNRFVYYILFFVAACLIVSCSQHDENDLHASYITFSHTANPDTRSGQCLESLDGSSFGVRGYKYTTKWESEEAEAKPDAKWINTKVNCSNGGLCTYGVNGVPEKWEHNMNYSFFAYHPHTDVSTSGAISLSPDNAFKAPVLHYKYEPTVLKPVDQYITLEDIKTNMYDVMTAHSIDNNEINSSRVNLDFKHHLFGAELVLLNYNDEADPAIAIYNVSMILDMKNESLDIPMDGKTTNTAHAFTIKDTWPDITNSDGTVVKGKKAEGKLMNFNFLNTKNNPLMLSSTLNSAPVEVSKDTHLLLIPQTGISGRVTVTYKLNDKVFGFKSTDINFTKLDLLPGTRYIFAIVFVGDNINFLIFDADSWVDSNVDIEFE